jgi:hypothetical protein
MSATSAVISLRAGPRFISEVQYLAALDGHFLRRRTVLEQGVLLAPDHGERQAVPGGVAGRELGDAFPFDITQVGVDDVDAVADTRQLGASDKLVKHRCAVLAA